MSIEAVNSWDSVSDLSSLNSWLEKAKVSKGTGKVDQDTQSVSTSEVVQRLKGYAKMRGAKQADVVAAAEKLLQWDMKPLPKTGRKTKTAKVSGVVFGTSAEDLQEITAKIRNNTVKTRLAAKQAIAHALGQHVSGATAKPPPEAIEDLYRALTVNHIVPKEVERAFDACLESLFPKASEKQYQSTKQKVLDNIVADLTASNETGALSECLKVFAQVRQAPTETQGEKPVQQLSTPVEAVLATKAPVTTTSVSSSSSQPVCPSTRQLVEDFESRLWKEETVAFPFFHNELQISGYLPPGKTAKQRQASSEKDQQQLLDILDAHNRQFASKISEKSLTEAGSVEKLCLQAGETVCVRADLHSDLRSLMTQLRLLQKEKLLDENFKCKEGFHLVFLGDYMDRGMNDVEVFSLLLTLRMLNPTSVHLGRGNHEDIGKVQLAYSSIGQWLQEHKEPIHKCYQSLPLSICMGVDVSEQEKAKGAQPEYCMLTHALFAPHVDLMPLFEGKEKSMEVSDTVTDTIQVPRRWKSVKGLSPKLRQATKKVSRWIVEANKRRQEAAEKLRLTAAELFTWTRLSPQEETDTGGQKEDIQAWMQLNRIKFVIRGHEHEMRELAVPTKAGGSKVIMRTLPAGPATGVFADRPGKEVQGMLLTVTGRKVKEWDQQVIRASGSDAEYAMKIDPNKTKMFAQVGKK